MQIRRHSLLSVVAGLSLAGAPVSQAQFTSSNRDVLAPNTGTWSASGVTLGGTSFVNLGLQGVGRVAANSIDPVTGESLGSISDMQITGWLKNLDGSYSGTFNFLPDRGYNAGTTFSNYAARINTFDFTFTPYTSTAITAAQNQIVSTFTGSTRFTYDHDGDSGTAGKFSTGLLATGSTTLGGQTVPVNLGNTTQSDGTVNNRLTIDGEGLVLDTRPGKEGSGWVSDEYGATVYHFNASKQIDGVLGQPAATVPHSPVGTTNFAADPPANGRRTNQGFEGLAVHGDKMFALLQSATIQDSTASGNVGRSNTRLLVYDLSASDSPTNPAKEYVIQLPRVDDNGGTVAVNKTAAQSSVIAINDHQILILSREGNGRGANNGSPVFKSILLADLSTATDILGQFDAEGNAVAPSGTLNAAVTPISWTEALNMLGKLDLAVSELAQFGLNLNANNGDINTLSEKWEALSLVSAMDASAPNDYFLFVGNDNDFATGSGKLLQADGTLLDYGAGLENDTMVLAFRVQIAAVPEPATVAGVISVGLLGIIARRRRQRHAAAK